MTASVPRTPLQVTLSVWRALFMREALGRLAAGRAGWVWLLLEPVAHVGMLMVLFSLLQRGNVPGIDFALFVAVGLLGFKSFMYTGSRSASALAANKGLLGYRQVKPVDTVLVRAALEGVINVFVALVLLALAVLVGFDAVPHDPVKVIESFALLWMLGAGFGLTVSVGTALVPEIERIVGLISTPLYFASGVFFSPGLLPPQAQEWLLLNPIVHGLELARSGFFAEYHLAQGVSDGYLTACALGLVLLGLALQRRFAVKLAAQ